LVQRENNRKGYVGCQLSNAGYNKTGMMAKAIIYTTITDQEWNSTEKHILVQYEQKNHTPGNLLHLI
jgi:hypothetical protein